MSRTYVIADIGANCDGNQVLLFAAISEAQSAGCDAIKFQWTSDPDAMAARRGRATADGYAEIYRRYLTWPYAEQAHVALAHECLRVGIDYMCTAFLPQDVAVVAPHVAKFKIASFEATDRAMWDAHLPYRDKAVLVSAGMLDDATAVGAVRGSAISDRFDVGLLQCVSAYPAPVAALNLALLAEEAPIATPTSPRVYAGLSDHTDPLLTWTGALAVAAGARVVEAHLRLDETDPQNPDYAHAMTWIQFREYVRNIRFAETALGDGVKRLEPCEAAMAAYRVDGLSG